MTQYCFLTVKQVLAAPHPSTVTCECFCQRTDKQNANAATGVALAGILAVLHSCLDLKATIGGSQYHHILYFLTPAMKPRMLMTVDKDMNLLPVSVRVGQAVDVVAQVRQTTLR